MTQPETRMTDDTWSALVKRFANGRRVCNCGQAYYSLDGEALVGGEKMTNHPHCKYGCSANQYAAKGEIARAVFAEFRAARPSPVEPTREMVEKAWDWLRVEDRGRDLGRQANSLTALLTALRAQVIEEAARVAERLEEPILKNLEGGVFSVHEIAIAIRKL